MRSIIPWNLVFNILFITVSTQNQGLPRLYYESERHQNVTATLGSNVTVSACVIHGKTDLAADYDLYVNDVRLDIGGHHGKYEVTFEHISPWMTEVVVTVVDVMPSDLTTHVIRFEELLSEKTVFSFNFRITAGVPDNRITTDVPDNKITTCVPDNRITSGVPDNTNTAATRIDSKDTLYIAVVILSTFLTVVTLLTIYKHIKGQSYGRYHVRSTQKSQEELFEDDHYEKLNETTYSTFGGGLGGYDRPGPATPGEQGEGVKYSTLYRDSNPPTPRRVETESHPLSEVEYIIPSDEHDWQESNPRPCLMRVERQMRKNELKEECSPHDVSHQSDVTEHTTLPIYPPRRDKKSLPGLQESESLSYVYVSDYSAEIVKNFVDNPLYCNELDERKTRLQYVSNELEDNEPKQAKNNKTFADELAAIKDDIDKSVDTLGDFERTLRKKCKLASDVNSREDDAEEISVPLASDQRLEESSLHYCNQDLDTADDQEFRRIGRTGHRCSEDDNVNLSVYVQFFQNLAQDERYSTPNEYGTFAHESNAMRSDDDDEGDSPTPAAGDTDAAVTVIPEVPSSPFSRDMRSYFHRKINDDEIDAMFELMNYVQKPDT